MPIFLLCWSPVLLLIVLAVVFKRPALDLSIVCTLFSACLVFFFFDTSLVVIALSVVDGILTTLPLLLVVFTGIFLSNFLLVCGSLSRLVDWFLGGVKNAFHRELLIVLGLSNFMEGSGVIAEPVVAPMMRATGVSPAGSAALSVIGYSGLMTLELAGIIITVLSLVTGIPVRDLGIAAGWLSIPAMAMMAACIPFFLDGKPQLKSIFFSTACGVFVGVVTLLGVVCVGPSVSAMGGGLALIVGLVLLGPRRLAVNRTVVRDVAPFLLMLVALLLVNTVPILHEWTFRRLVFSVRLIPIHSITFRPFFSPYLYLIAASLLAVYLNSPPRVQLKSIVLRSVTIGLRISFIMGLFGAMGQIIAYSGYSSDFGTLETTRNIPWQLANGLQKYTGGFYPAFVPLLGWVGTFLTGYGVASLMLFGQLQVDTANLMGVSATWLAAGLAVGASLGSISSPFKIALSTPMCDALGQEGKILRWTIPLGIAAALVIGVILWLVL